MVERVKSKVGKFYVYEHWRPDKDVCFYVGKGKDNRAYNFDRKCNPFYKRIVRKLNKKGMCIEVRMVESGLFEKYALKLEIQRIAFWRSNGIKLANLTDGGEGSSGFVPSKKTRALKARIGRTKTHSPKTRAILSYNQKHRPKEYWDNISAKLKGRPLPKWHCKKLSEAAKNRPPISEETRTKLSTISKSRIRTPEWKAKAGASIKASWHKRAHRPAGMVGKRHSAESRQKMSKSRSAYWAAKRERESLE
jgi:hypothetical protein